MNDTQLPIPIIPADRRLTAAEFQGLAEAPPELEWFRNLNNAGTERVYRNAIADFMRFTGIVRPEEFRIARRAELSSKCWLRPSGGCCGKVARWALEAKIVAQSRAAIITPEQAARLQFWDHQIDESSSPPSIGSLSQRCLRRAPGEKARPSRRSARE